MWPGSYDQCLNISVSGEVTIKTPASANFVQNASFDGMYCSAKMINSSIVISDAIVHGDLRQGFQLGICAPKSCGSKSVQVVYELGE